MGNIFLIVFIAVLYGIWKGLDALQLPNTMSILLVGLVVICGGFWLYNKFVLGKRRKAKIKAEEERLNGALTPEEKEEALAKLPKTPITEFFSSLFGVLALVTIFRSFIFEPFQIPSGSMEPTLLVGDFLLVEKYAYGIKDPIGQNTLIETGHPERGDVVVFKSPLHPNVDYIKRVVGIGGDTVKYNSQKRELTVIHGDGKTVAFRYQGDALEPNFFYHGEMQIERTEIGDVTHQILVNPKPLDFSSYYYKQDNVPVGTWIVPKGQCFVMGDNRDNSEDSRFWGFVPEKNLVGKARFIWLSLDKKPNEFPKGLRFSRMFSSIN